MPPDSKTENHTDRLAVTRKRRNMFVFLSEKRDIDLDLYLLVGEVRVKVAAKTKPEDYSFRGSSK